VGCWSAHAPCRPSRRTAASGRRASTARARRTTAALGRPNKRVVTVTVRMSPVLRWIRVEWVVKVTRSSTFTPTNGLRVESTHSEQHKRVSTGIGLLPRVPGIGRVGVCAGICARHSSPERPLADVPVNLGGGRYFGINVNSASSPFCSLINFCGENTYDKEGK
jgi:hypothetical protein